MSTSVCNNLMEYSILNIRDQLRIYDIELKDDKKKFNEKLNLTRQNFFDYINRLIEQLNEIKREYELEFNYLENENNKTCYDNQQRFQDLQVFIEKYQNQQEKLGKYFNEFKETFPMRPNMFKNIPEFHLEDIHFDSLIRKSNQPTLITNHTNENHSILTETKLIHSSSPITFNEELLPEEDQSLELNSNERQSMIDNPRLLSSSLHCRLTLEDAPSIVPITTVKINESIEHSHHQQFASKDNPMIPIIESESRSVSTVCTMNGSNNRVDILFQVPYESDRHCRLMAYNIHDNCLLIYSLISHKFEYLSISTRQINRIYFSSNDSLVSLGYSINHRCFYLINKSTHDLVLFHLNGQQIEVEQQFKLTHENMKIDSLLVGHIYENNFYLLYNLSPDRIIFGTYDVNESTLISFKQLENILYDENQQLTYEIIDFVVNNSYITFLTRLKDDNRYKVIIHDHDINQIFSFDLIDAKQPLSIVSTIKTSQSASFNEESQLLLFINDPKSHFIHCCTYERYLISIEVNSFAICSLNDGNLAIVANKDIRGLKVQDYLKQNHVQTD